MIRAGADSGMEKIGNYTPLTPLSRPTEHPAGGNNPGINEVTGKIRAGMDSLQSRLDSLQSKATGRVEKAEEAGENITRKIHSVRRFPVGNFKELSGINNEILKRVQDDVVKTIRHPGLARLPALWSNSSGGQAPVGGHQLSWYEKFNAIMIAPVPYRDLAVPSAGRVMESFKRPDYPSCGTGNGDLGPWRPPGIRRYQAVIFTGDPPGSLMQSAVSSKQSAVECPKLRRPVLAQAFFHFGFVTKKWAL